MKKSKYRRLKALSFILSVIMIMCSIPMTATAEPLEPTKGMTGLQSKNDDSIIAESFEYSDPTRDWQGLPIDSEESLALASAESARSTNGEVTAGVYAFKNVENEGLWIDTRNNSYNSGAYIQQYAYSSNPATESVFSRGGLFKISKHATYGTYIIRSMLNNRYTFTLYSTNGTNYIQNQSIPLNDAEVPIEKTFYIQYDSTKGGYTIKQYGTNYYVTSCHESASGASGGTNSYLQFTSSATSESAWTMYKYIGTFKNGATLERPSSWTSTGLIVDSYYNPRLLSWSTVTNYNTPYICPQNTSGELVDYAWNITTARVSITPRFPGELNLRVGVALSSDNIQTTNNIFDIVDADTMQSPSYRIVPQAGDYYIQNAESEKYMYTSGTAASTLSNPLQYEYNQSFPLMMWEIQHVANSGGYVRIKSKGGNVYLGVNQSSDTDIVLSSTLNNYTLWKIDTTQRKTLVFKCKAFENTGYVMWAPNISNSAAIRQTTYVNDSTDLKDEWHLVKKVISMANYYDESFAANSTLISNISIANDFAKLVYARYFNLGINIIGSSTPHNVTSNSAFNASCQKDIGIPCDNSCGTVCSTSHHKNVSIIHNRLMDQGREIQLSDTIYVLWANRYESDTSYGTLTITPAFCDSQSGAHQLCEGNAFVRNKRPIIQMLMFPTSPYVVNLVSPENQVLGRMCSTLVHEMTHTLGMDDIYTDITNGTHTDTTCIMAYSDYRNGYNLYCNIPTGDARPFCKSCTQTLKDHINYILSNNIHLEFQ